MKRRPHLFLWLSGACALAVGVALGCQPGQVGETTDGGAAGTGGTTSGGGSSGNAGAGGGSGSIAGTTGAGDTSGTAGTSGGTGPGGSAAGQGGSTAGSAGGAAGRGGTGGVAGTTGAAGRGGTGGGAGGGGTVGAAGRGGTGGAAGTTGAAGRGGTGGGAAGAAGGGGGTGGGSAGTGGSGPTQCTLQNHSGNGSFTWYNFAQGTARDGNGYRTACGYYGTANGTTDTVENIASTSPAAATYFAAIPGQNGFDSKSHCGECVQITGQNGTVIIATVIDECPYGNDGGNTACQANAGGHLDLSKTAFDRLGYPVGNPSNTNWKFVPCPVSGNVKVRFKSGNNNEFFVENIITPIASVTVNGTGASRQSYGAWHVASAITTPATLNLTDMAGRSITVTLNSGTSNQDTGRQFPTCL
jgi:expansin (peptidoglycan-binding protein)